MTIRQYVAPASLVLAGVIHVLPLAGVMGSETLYSLYAVAIDEPNLELLLRHRAILFGILGAFLIVSAFRAHLRPSAFLLGLSSVVSFLVLAAFTEGLNAQLANVVAADVVALVALLAGTLAGASERRVGAT